MFQAMGNTMPSLVASVTRIVVIAVPAIAFSTMPGFQLVWIWYLSAGAVVLQLAIVLVFLRREFRLRLDSMPPPVMAQPVADSAVPRRLPAPASLEDLPVPTRVIRKEQMHRIRYTAAHA